MANFNEHALELSIMKLFKDEGYIYLAGEQIHRERTEVLLADDLRQYLYNRYAKDGITPGEVDGMTISMHGGKLSLMIKSWTESTPLSP